MRNLNKIKKLIHEDKGSTLITVIVVIGFVTILTTIILGSSLANIRMKAIDRRAKDDFYYAERALNDIYTGVGQEIAVIAANAYDSAFSRAGGKIVKSGGGGTVTIDVSTSQLAEKYYREVFFKDVMAWASANANPKAFQKYLTDTSVAQKKSYVIANEPSDPEKPYDMQVEDNAETPVTEEAKYATDAVCVRIKDVGVITADESRDYKGEIVTDIVISIPMMGFFDNNVDVTDYSIIANEGIDIKGDVTFSDGNVYAGLSESGGEGVGGFSIVEGDVDFEGSYLVCKGDISVGSSGKNAKLTVGATRSTRPNIWCDSIITVENAVTPSIDVNANTFALNDLELNALGSSVKFAGTYYGYDEGYLAHAAPLAGPTATPAPTFDMLIGKGKEHSDSSAIIINGDQSTLDMKRLNTLMLMGKAYIETPDGSEISTAEAMALRTNQQLYLVPPDFLDCPNPIAGEKDEDDWNCNISEKWFGYKYLKKKESGKPEIKAVKVGSGSDTVSYAFLEFDDTGDYDLTALGGSAHNKARSAFVYEILHGVDTVAPGETVAIQPKQSQLKERITNSLANFDSFQLQECVVNNSTDANIYSVNALANYIVVDSDDGINGYSGITSDDRIGDVGTIVPVSNTAAMDRYASYPQNLFRRFQWLCTMLINNEDIPLSQTVNPVPAVEGNRAVRQIDESSAWKADSDYPYKYYVKTPEEDDLDGNADASRIPSSSYGEFIYTTDSNYHIDRDFKGVVIATEDITVDSGKDISGTLIARGKIIFKGGNDVKSDRALIQKRISKEMELEKEDGIQCVDYLISYLDGGNGTLLYGGIAKDGLVRNKAEERTDYTEYVFFENWKKGGK